MNNRSLMVLILFAVLVVGGYLVYQNNQGDDIRIELPDIDIR